MTTMIPLQRSRVDHFGDHSSGHLSTHALDVDDRLLVELKNTQGELSPLFCIHPSGGDVGVYRKLARRLNRERPVVGIQSKLMLGAKEEFDSIKRMARAYTHLIDKRYPSGPIQLLGFSFGGFVATQISNEFQKLNREVSFLGLVDSDLGWLQSDRSGRDELVIRLGQLCEKFQEVGLIEPIPETESAGNINKIVDQFLDRETLSLSEIMEDVRERGLVIRTESGAEALGKFVFSFVSHCRLLQKFRPQEFDAPTFAWWPSEAAEKADSRARSRDWQTYSIRSIAETTLEGSHYTVMRMPTARILAEQIEAALSGQPTANAN